MGEYPGDAVSVAAFNEEVLRLANIQSSSDLMFKTPGVYLSGSGGRENSVFQIRVQTKALGGSNALAVVSYLADVPQSTFGSGCGLTTWPPSKC
ncbi:hypothetical protein [Novosphingobium resinovorum]|uniref:hypothetical protein n=1 Tax=Novosphingobium resinovorum TaxID=158500 RepID=UPI003D2E3821